MCGEATRAQMSACRRLDAGNRRENGFHGRVAAREPGVRAADGCRDRGIEAVIPQRGDEIRRRR